MGPPTQKFQMSSYDNQRIKVTRDFQNHVTKVDLTKFHLFKCHFTGNLSEFCLRLNLPIGLKKSNKQIRVTTRIKRRFGQINTLTCFSGENSSAPVWRRRLLNDLAQGESLSRNWAGTTYFIA